MGTPKLHTYVSTQTTELLFQTTEVVTAAVGMVSYHELNTWASSKRYAASKTVGEPSDLCQKFASKARK